jgi:hypothetical protein
VAGSTILTLPATSGTVQTSGAGFTTNGVAYASSTSALATGSSLTFDGTNLGVGVAASGFGRLAVKASGTGSTNGLAIQASADESFLSIYSNGSVHNIEATYGSTGSYQPIRLNVSGAEIMRLTSTGVGIGTSSPVAPVTANRGNVSGAGQWASSAIAIANPTNTGSYSQISFGYTVGTTNASAYMGFVSTNQGTNGYGDLVFGTRAVITDTQPTERMRLDSTGNLGIGTTSPAYRTEIVGGADTVETTLLQLRSNFGGTGTGSTINFRNSTNSAADSGGVQLAALRDTSSGGSFVIRTADSSGTIQNRVKITETGLFAIGTTTPVSGNTNARLVIKSSGGSDAGEIQATTNGILAFDFRNASGTQVGSIAINASTTSYNVTSDYRLKNTVTPMTGALAKVALLKPVTYKWNADGSDGEGFIAHELAEVCPYAVHGTKDAVDADGNIKPQGIDVSFLVATLTAAIQEQQALITTLTERITALEGA